MKRRDFIQALLMAATTALYPVPMCVNPHGVVSEYSLVNSWYTPRKGFTSLRNSWDKYNTNI